MRINNNLFLAKANLKGSKKKNTVMVMMILSVISITLLVGFLGVANNICEGKSNYKYCRQVYVFPKSEYEEDGKVGVTEKTINTILETEHVVSCEKVVLPTTLQYLTVNKSIRQYTTHNQRLIQSFSFYYSAYFIFIVKLSY